MKRAHDGDSPNDSRLEIPLQERAAAKFHEHVLPKFRRRGRRAV